MIPMALRFRDVRLPRSGKLILCLRMRRGQKDDYNKRNNRATK
jgi:hypothetical protein